MESGRESGAAEELAWIDRAGDAYLQAPAGEWRYHAVLGLFIGAATFAQCLPAEWAAALFVPCIVALPVLMAWWRRTHGWWVWGWAPGKTLWLAAVMVPVIAAMAFWSSSADSWQVSLIAGIVNLLVTTAYGFAWMHLWRQGLRTDPRSAS